MADGCHLENQKIVVSPKLFGQFRQHVCMVTYTDSPNHNVYSKIQIFRNSRWQIAIISKTVKCDI